MEGIKKIEYFHKRSDIYCIVNFKFLFFYTSNGIHIFFYRLSEIHSSVLLSSSITMPGGQRLKLPNRLSQCIEHDGALFTKSSSIPFNNTPSQDDVHATEQYTMAQPSSADPIGVPIVHGTSVVDGFVLINPGLVLMQQQQPFAEHSSIGAVGRP